ncbi:MAG: hypothetical protein IKM24_06665 [Clostridia bacterium]|nr:hypothetical protein [Clostridia bacterium]MBR6780682.1 hypothetical protein [Clostridia bacterium]
MIGIGTWKGNVQARLFSGDVEVVVIDNNGEYDFDFKLPGKLSMVKINVLEVNEVGTDTLEGKGAIRGIIPGKEIIAEVSCTFSGDTMNATVSIPKYGMGFKIKDGVRIA